MARGVSAVLSFMLAISLFAGMQAFRTHLAQSKAMTILGGFLGSQIFVFLLTAFNNFEAEFMNDNFQSKLIPEVLISLLVSIVACALVHRVCITVCIITSMTLLYYINRISARKYAPMTTVGAVTHGKRKKN